MEEVAVKQRPVPSEGFWDGSNQVEVTAGNKLQGVVRKESPRAAGARSPRVCRALKDVGFYSKCEERPLAKGVAWQALSFRELEWGQGHRLGGCRCRGGK